MLIDTHCHLDLKDFDKDRDDAIKRAVENGVGYIINIGSSLEGSQKSLELARKYKEVFASVGIHPHDASKVDDGIISEIQGMAGEEKVVAIGEIGLDYYRNISPKEVQKTVFRTFARLAKESGLPLIIHNRRADDDALNILREELGGSVKGVMHCFSGDMGFLERCLDMGLYISFTCNITYKKADKLREAAAHVPVERLLLETDAPFLAPQSKRGKRNEPSYLAYLVKELARIKNIEPKKIEETTTQNAIKLFNLKKISLQAG